MGNLILHRDRALRLRRVIVSLALMTPMILLSGCGVAVLATKLGMQRVKPVYVPPQTPLLVLAENFRSPASHALEADQLARFITEELKRHEVAPVVEQDKLDHLRLERREQMRELTIPQVGEAVGAQQVLYVDIVESNLNALAGSEMAKGSIAINVRFVDVATGFTTWPSASSEGFPVAYETPYVRGGPGVDEGTVRTQVLRALADRTARLFYSYHPDEVPRPEAQ